ncbi:MAG: hypothetical protein AUI15_31765 [Actinobacteria bacterium 13_2_20CM_2_66_6]|nr:MAG: hypothetical protein AUI15_31765 [Actinobacteria bacterium 13_2_20CM_2_66_6]
MATRIFLVRHADVENPNRVLYGHLPGFELSALGRAQAAALGEKLSAENVRLIVHSPLSRAAETASIINRGLQHRRRGDRGPWGARPESGPPHRA